MIYDPLKEIQNAWMHTLLDFRAWYIPDTAQTQEWKMRDVAQAMRTCQARMMDDSEAMLVAYRKNNNDPQVKVGASAALPILLTATAAVDAPPEVSKLLGTPYFVDVIIKGKFAKLRVIPKAIRAQVAFFAVSPHDARGISDQLCAYFADDKKRRFNVNFKLADDLRDDFRFTIFENELYPTSVPTEALNLSIFTVDVTLVGYVPQVVAVDGVEHTVDNGYDDTGKPITQAPVEDLVIIQADSFEDDRHSRVKTDRITGESTIEHNLKEPKP